jgi:hypothetical protein
MMKTVTVLAIVLSVQPSTSSMRERLPGQQPETYDSAKTDGQGNLVISTSRGRTILVPKEGEQSSFARPVLSTARTAVGAQAEYPNCCTSYDIPLQLVIYAGGKVHRFKGNGLPIFWWHFADSGSRIAFGQTTVHFGCEIHYELRDIQTERLVATADIPEPCGQFPNPPVVEPPQWVVALRSEQR